MCKIMSEMFKLSNTQRKLLEIIRNSIAHGNELSVRDLMDEMGFSSTRSITYQLEQLGKAGYLVRDASGKIVRVNTVKEGMPAVSFLPLLGNAPCGAPFNVEENYERLIPVPLRLLGRNTKKKLYLVKAVGDSMSPKIEDGDLVIFEPNPSPESGSIVVARTDEGVIIKRFKDLGSQLVLEPINKKFFPLVFEKDRVSKRTLEIDGVAITVIKAEENLRKGGE